MAVQGMHRELQNKPLPRVQKELAMALGDTSNLQVCMTSTPSYDLLWVLIDEKFAEKKSASKSLLYLFKSWKAL